MSDAIFPEPRTAAAARPSRAVDAIVFVSVSAVAGAFALGLALHADVPLPIAVGAALTLHLALFAFHLMLARRTGGNRSSRPRATPAPRTRPAARTVERSEPRLAPGSARTPGADPAARPARAFAPQPADPHLPVPASTAQPTAEPRTAATRGGPGDAPGDGLAARPNPATAAAFDEILRDLARTLEVHGRPAVTDITPSTTTAAKSPTPPAEPQIDAERIITQSVAALRTAGEAMQSYETKPAPRTQADDGQRKSTTPAARTPTKIVLEEMAEAVESERVELAVSQIRSLSDDRVAHHELLMRLVTNSGEVVIPQGLASAVRGTGLVPLLDTLKVSRAVKVAQSFEVAGEPGAIFCRVTGEGLMSKRVVRALAGEPGHMPPAATRVVLCLIQQEVRAFGHAHWTTLADLADQGFRFCVSEITDLDVDAPALRNVGFVFARVNAPALAAGLMMRKGMVPASELGRHLTSAGLTVMADQIDDEAAQQTVRAAGIAFGQGELFGAPRPITLPAKAA